MLPPSEPPPADRAAAHPVTAPEADVASRLSSSSAGTRDWSRTSTQPPTPIEVRMQTRSNATPEPASDSDSGSDAFYGLHTEDDAPTSPTAPLAPFPPLPPPAARSRAPEFYGFVAATGTYLVFALYLLWAFLPDDAILALGVTWYPNRCVGIPVPLAARRTLMFVRAHDDDNDDDLCMVPCPPPRPRTPVNLRPRTSLRLPTTDARHHVSAHLRCVCARPCARHTMPRPLRIPAGVCMVYGMRHYGLLHRA